MCPPSTAWRRSFALLRSVSHPNIINYYFFEHSRSKKVCRIVMEFLAGDSTLNLLQKFGPLTETILRKLTRNLLQAIAFIHKEGIFHRDIKPANILVSHKGVVKLCDFGCSKRVEELSKASSCIIGTPVYMAPELIKGEANHKADIWSMACSLFELGTGLLPWYHSGVKDHLPLMFYITTTSETPLVLPAQDNVSEFSPEFMDFMEQSFIRDPDRRPEASELLKHPWIVGTKLPPKVSKTSALYAYLQNEKINGLTKPTRSSGGDDIDGGESSASRESAPSPPVETSASVYDEAVCQQELEVVAASISVDLCSNLMLSNDTVSRQLEQKFAEHSDYSPSNSQQSPSVSNRGPISTSVGDIGSLNVSPEVSMVHENYFYPQASFGASGGTFVLPTEGFSYGTQQQYLRINDDGNLDFATFPDDDNDIFTETYNLRSVSVDSSVLTTPQLMNHMMTPGKNSSFSRGSFLPPPTERGNTPQRMSPGHASKGESPYRTGQGSRPPPVLTNLSPSLSPSGFSNSPRISQTASLSSSARLEFPFSPRSPVSPQSSGVHPFPLKSKANAEGKLNMSFCVNTAPGQEINVDLSFDVNDVQCKMVDNQPNYVVAMTDNIKGQIANKIKEVSSRGGLSGNSSPSSVNNRTRDMPRNSTGSHFYNSPNWNSAASNNRQSVPKLRGRYSTGGIPITSGVPHSGFGDSGSSLASRCSTPAGSLTSGTPHISPRNRRN
ncbi:protein kinase [Angomonas deanei]|uniref:mitogen-activated protein kinase kinase n=1 Tax=Angomonas deanei TaxID=59799 RepID=A0A7G2CBZ2_9TRYP|nr:protein kinase [Angomonas deanei]CAD2216444.1 Protein tyrosine kinase/Protein kinase domain containing protein, putative [Angomonas deanei]|eukprot:EPY28981.1 protein kinase [Angomonas deanei]